MLSQNVAETVVATRLGLFWIGCNAPSADTRRVDSSEDAKVIKSERSATATVSAYPLAYTRDGVVECVL